MIDFRPISPIWMGLTLMILAACVAPPKPISKLKLSGHEIQGGIIRGSTLPGTTLLLDGRQVMVSPEGWFVFGLGRDDGRAELIARYPNGQTEVRWFDPLRRQYETQEINHLPTDKVNPLDGHAALLKRDNARVSAARDGNSRLPHFAENFIWPLIGPVTGVYGSVRVLNGQTMQPHFGIDIAGPKGAPVIAPAGGTVVLAETDMVLTGGTIVIDHGYGLSSTFIHLDQLSVSEGQIVLQGEAVGTVGQTGRATGPHLDWRVNWFDKRLDPSLVMAPMGQTPAPAKDLTEPPRSLQGPIIPKDKKLQEPKQKSAKPAVARISPSRV